MSSKEKAIDDQIDSNLTAILGIAVLSYSERYIDKNRDILQNRNKKSYNSKYMDFR